METWPNHITDPFIQFDWHSGQFLHYVPPIPAPVPGHSLHLSIGIHLMPEMRLGTSKSNKWRVLANHIPVVSRGHECAYLVVPHLNIDLWDRFNLSFPALILGSSTVCQYAVGSVLCQDGPIAVSVNKQTGNNWSCQDVGLGIKKNKILGFYLPTCFTFNYSTVDIGFTLDDVKASYACAILDILKTMLVSVVLMPLKLGEKGEDMFKNTPIKKFFDKMLKPQVIAILGRNGISTIFRGAGGRFASTAEALGASAVEGMLQWLGGSRISDTVEVFTAMSSNGLDGRLGAHLDQNSEALGY